VWWGSVSIRHYQLRCREEASSNCYHKRKKAGKKIREKVVLIMRQEGGSIDGDLSNDKNQQFLRRGGDTYPRSRDEKLHSPILPDAMGVDSLN